MSEHSSKPSYTADDEIDLGVVFKALADFFKKVLIGVISVFKFYYKHKFILLGLIIIGAVLGYFWEKSFDKNYTNQLLVIPNFESTDYLYHKIESIDSKLGSNDTLFLREIFGKEYRQVTSLEVKPVVDIYNFVSESDSNQEVFELLFEEEASLEFLENPINSRNYKYHNIILGVKGEAYHKDLSDALLDYLNENEYFKEVKQITLDNLEIEIEQNKAMVSQIDTIIANPRKGISKIDNTSGISFTDNVGLNDLLSKKKYLIEISKQLEIYKREQTHIVKQVDANYKIFKKEDLLKTSKVKLFPLLLLLLYSLIFLARYLSKKAKAITS